MIENPEKVSFEESRLRSLVKSIIYRILSILGTGILTWFITKDIAKTISITFANQVFLIILYYLSERIWNKIHWGKKVHISQRHVTLQN